MNRRERTASFRFQALVSIIARRIEEAASSPLIGAFSPLSPVLWPLVRMGCVSRASLWILKAMRKSLALGALGLLCAGFVGRMSAQSLGAGGTVRGTVLDPSGAAVAQADVTIGNPVFQYRRGAKTDAQGNFEFDNLPLNNYHATAKAPGFQGAEQDLNVRSAVPLEVKFNLKIGQSTTEVTVTEAADLVLPPSSTRTVSFTGSAITRQTRSPSTGSRLPTSKAKSSRIRFRSIRCSRWR